MATGPEDADVAYPPSLASEINARLDDLDTFAENIDLAVTALDARVTALEGA